MRSIGRTLFLFAVGLLSLGVSPAWSGDRAIETPEIRFGDAAGPFGWATVMADFNRDGMPDYAIADQSRSPRGSGFTIEFAISGEPSSEVAFRSPHRFVTLSVADVDHDSDPDLLVSIALSGARVAVWLNDGHGHFSSADVRAFSGDGTKHTASFRLTSPDETSLTLAPTRTSNTLPSTACAAAPAVSIDRVPSRSSRVTLDRAAAHALLRAPPSSALPTA
jgi:hypothetical protein